MSDRAEADAQRDFRVEVERASDQHPVVTVAGDVDLHSAPVLRDTVTAAFGDADERVTVDLTATTFLDSMGLGVLLGAKKRLAEGGGELDLVVATPELRRVFEITMLDRVFEIHSSRSEAGLDDRSGAV